LLVPDERGDGELMVPLDEPFTNFEAVGMTVEPEGGSPGPTGARVVSSRS